MKYSSLNFTFLLILLVAFNSTANDRDERAKAPYGASWITVADNELPDPPILGGKEYEDEWKNSRCRVRVAPLEANLYALMWDTAKVDWGTCSVHQAFLVIAGNLKRLEHAKKPTDRTGKESGWLQYKLNGASRFQNCPYRVKEDQPISAYLHRVIFDQNELEKEYKKDPKGFFLKFDRELSKLIETNCPTS